MKIFYLIDGDNIIDKCTAYSKEMAEQEFSNRGWVIGEVIPEIDL